MLRKNGSGRGNRRLWSFVPLKSLGGLCTGACPGSADRSAAWSPFFLFLPQPGASRILARPHKGGHVPQPQHLLGRYQSGESKHPAQATTDVHSFSCSGHYKQISSDRLFRISQAEYPRKQEVLSFGRRCL